MMTFKEYLQTRRVTDTPAGDFTGDARRDKRLPDVQSWDELKVYLDRFAGASIRDDVIRAAYQVWRGYKAKLKQTEA